MRPVKVLAACLVLFVATGCAGAGATASYGHSVEGTYNKASHYFKGNIGLAGINERGSSQVTFYSKAVERAVTDCPISTGSCVSDREIGRYVWGPGALTVNGLKYVEYIVNPPYQFSARLVTHTVTHCDFADGASCDMAVKEPARWWFPTSPPCPTPQAPILCQVNIDIPQKRP